MDQSEEIIFSTGHLKKLSIPSTSLGGNYVVYHIEVCLANYSWIVKRRYREFCELHEKLIRKYEVNESLFPPKKYVGNFNPQHIEKRRRFLELYLQDFLTRLERIPRVLQIFLEFHIYDIFAVTQTLAEKLFKVGDSLLIKEEPFFVTPLQLYCISRRLKLPIPTCASEGYHHDVGNLYDIVYCVKDVKIVEDDNHELIGLPSEEISFDLSMFKNLESLEVSDCNIESLQGTFHLQENLKKLSVHSSLHLLKDILIDQGVWTAEVHCGTFTNSSSSCTSLAETHSAMVWKNLTEVDFSQNSIPYIDESVTLLSKLEKLDLSHNQIKEVEHLQDLPNLRELDLSHNQIESLEGVNTKLGNVQILKLASNRLQFVGDTPKVYSLVELDLGENYIDDVSCVLALADLPCLEVLNLLGNPVRKKEMYRAQLLTAFEERVSQICLDKITTTRSEIEDVMSLLTHMDSYELINPPVNRTPLMTRHKTGQKKTIRRIKVKNQDLLESPATEVASVLSDKTTHLPDGDQEFKNKVEQIRHIGGDDWLGMFNELQNEYKSPVDPQRTSSPNRSCPVDQRSATANLASLTSEMNINDNQTTTDAAAKHRQVGQPIDGRSVLQFGFSTELEDLVNEKLKESKDLVEGSFIASVEVDEKKSGEEKAVHDEERMIGVNLNKRVLMEIAMDTLKTCAKHKLDDVTSVDILEECDAFFVDLLHTETKQMRRHRDFELESGHHPPGEGCRHIARYKMRSMKDAAELFVLLFKFINDSSNSRLPAQPESRKEPSVENHPSQRQNPSTKILNPAGISPDLFHQFLTDKFLKQQPLEDELTESARDAIQAEKEEVQFVLWTSCLPYALPDHDLPVCLVLTNINICLFQLKDDGQKHPVPSTSLEDIEAKLTTLCCLPLAQLRVVIRGLFELSFRLEFSKRGSRGTFTFLTRDPEETESFLRILGDVTNVEMAAENSENRAFHVEYLNEEKLERMKDEITKSCGKAFVEDECILMYAIIREVPDMTPVFDGHVTLGSSTRTLVVTNWRLLLCEEDHVHWPLPSYVKDTPSTPQWVVTKYDDIKHIIGIELFDVIGNNAFVGTSGMSLLLENNTQRSGGSHQETKMWNLIFKVEEERQQLVRSLSQLWSDSFHGNLEITKVRPLQAQEIHHSSRVDVPSRFFQEVLPPASPPGTRSKSRPDKGHRRSASGHCYSKQHDDMVSKSVQVVKNTDQESLKRFFTEKLLPLSAGRNDEVIVCYAWTGCVAYCYPAREIHVWLILSNLKVYIVADEADRETIDAIQDVAFGPDTKLCLNWYPLTSLRRVNVGLFDQTFRLETDDPESTFAFITRDYEATNNFLEHLDSTLEDAVPDPAPSTDTATGNGSPSIYDVDSNDVEGGDEQSSEWCFHRSNGVDRFCYPDDDTVELLKHSILEFAKNSEHCFEMADVSVLMYLLVFQIVNGNKLPRTFMILDEAVCLCLENHVNYPLPLFVKGLPVGSRYEIKHLRPLVHIKRIEFSGFNTQDFTIVFEQTVQQQSARSTDKTESLEDTSTVVDVHETTPTEEVRWTLIAQTYEEREKAFTMILKFWKENCGQDLPVFKI